VRRRAFQYLAVIALLPLWASVARAEANDQCLPPGKLKVLDNTHSMIPYPPFSVQLDEQGTTSLRVTIENDGLPIDATVRRSSGSDRLDVAAVNHIKTYWKWEALPQGCAKTDASINIAWHIGMPPKFAVGLAMLPSFFPPGALDRMEAGDTYLELKLDQGGTVNSGKVIYGSGFPDLDEKALTLVNKKVQDLADQPAGIETVLIRWPVPLGVEAMSIYADRFVSQASKYPKCIGSAGGIVPIPTTHTVPNHPRETIGWKGIKATILQITIDDAGVPNKEFSLIQSSGYPFLDRLAEEHVLSKWRYAPPTSECPVRTVKISILID